MKKGLFYLMLLALTFSVLAVNSKAQTITPEQSVNLITGINSDNNGLIKSSIYYAGKYKAKAAVESLIKVLEKSGNSEHRILAAYALHEIGALSGYAVIAKIAEEEEDFLVRTESKILYGKFLENEIARFVGL